MRFLLDTSTCIAATKRHAHVIARMRSLRPDDIAIATITLYELEVGIAKCRDPEDEQRRIDLFLDAVHVIDFNRESARQAAVIRADLESRGRGIGPYDTLIAAVAVHHGLTLVSNNGIEFTRDAHLLWEDWFISMGRAEVVLVDPERLSTTVWWRRAQEEFASGKLTTGSPPFTVMSKLSASESQGVMRLRSDEAAVFATWARSLGQPLPFTVHYE